MTPEVEDLIDELVEEPETVADEDFADGIFMIDEPLSKEEEKKEEAVEQLVEEA